MPALSTVIPDLIRNLYKYFYGSPIRSGMTRRGGFTLVELLVVVAIIGVLSTIGITVFTGARQSANEAKVKADIDAIKKAYEAKYDPLSGVYSPLTGTDFSDGKIPTPDGTTQTSYFVDGPNANPNNPTSASNFALDFNTQTNTACLSYNEPGCYFQSSTQGTPVDLSSFIAITSIPGLKVWLKADAISGKSDGQSIGSWSDSSGNNYNATDPTSQQIIYKTVVQNNLPVVRFPGSPGNRLNIPGSLNIKDGSSGFAVFKTNVSDVTNTPQAIFSKGHGDLTFLQWTGAGIAGLGIHRSGIIKIAAENAAGSGDWQIAEYTYNSSGEGSVYRNGDLKGSGSYNVAYDAPPNGPFANNTTLYIGIDDPSSSTGSFNGDIAEIVIYNVALSDTNRKIVEKYLGRKYGITVAN